MHTRVVVRGVHLLPPQPACFVLWIAPSHAVCVLACLSAKLLVCLVWGLLEGEGCGVRGDGRGKEGATVHVFTLADMMLSLVRRCHQASRKCRPKRHRAWARDEPPHDKPVCYSYSALCDNIITFSFPYYSTLRPLLVCYNNIRNIIPPSHTPVPCAPLLVYDNNIRILSLLPILLYLAPLTGIRL